MITVDIDVKGPYSLAESRAFLEGFTPASGGSASFDDSLALAFRLDDTFAPVGALLKQTGAKVTCEGVGGDATRIAKQAARMLGLDVDARAWGTIAERDPVLGRVLAAHAGFRPVAFASPWEAGVWGLLAHRINMKQAASIKRKIAEQHGDVVTVGTKAIALFPSPKKVLAMPNAPQSVPEEKWIRIAGLADAALKGALDVDKLRAMTPDEAQQHLGTLRGVGTWTAGHIHIRGAATADIVSLDEPRVRRAVQHGYAMKDEPTDDEMRAISDKWKPYRTWAMVLLAMDLNRSGKWNAPTKAKRGTATKKRSPTRSPG